MTMNYLTIWFLAVAVSYAKANYGKGGGGGYSSHSIDAAVNSKHSVNTYPVMSSKGSSKNPVVDINSGPLPLTICFNSHSSQINAIQKHFGSPGQVQKSAAVDEADLLIQNIKKPIIQEVREVISPYRQRTQEVRPVQERIETIIAKGTGDGGSGGSYSKYSPKYPTGHDSY